MKAIELGIVKAQKWESELASANESVRKWAWLECLRYWDRASRNEKKCDRERIEEIGERKNQR